jgi:hypothetical protein
MFDWFKIMHLGLKEYETFLGIISYQVICTA